MEEINKIYDNNIGIAFQWNLGNTDITQVIFRDIGFHLNETELKGFLIKINQAKYQKRCNNCKAEKNCRSILLHTPSDKVSLAISLNELNEIEDLIRGTIFQLQLNSFVDNLIG